MRIKILMLGADTSSLMADEQLLKERGFLVLSGSNLRNMNELASEMKPDLVFFDPQEPNNVVTDACNDFVNNAHFTNIPVILTISDDDAYRVTPERTDNKDDRAMITDNILDAIKIALEGPRPEPKKIALKTSRRRIAVSAPHTAQLFA